MLPSEGGLKYFFFQIIKKFEFEEKNFLFNKSLLANKKNDDVWPNQMMSIRCVCEYDSETL